MKPFSLLSLSVVFAAGPLWASNALRDYYPPDPVLTARHQKDNDETMLPELRNGRGESAAMRARDVWSALRNGAAVDVEDYRGISLLKKAVERRDVDLVRALLAAGVDSATTDDFDRCVGAIPEVPELYDLLGTVPPHTLAFIPDTYRDEERVRTLTDKGLDVRTNREDGYSPLLAALAYGSPATIRLLLAHDATVDLDNPRLRLAIGECCRQDSTEALLDALPPEQRARLATELLYYQASTCDTALFDMLVAKGADILGGPRKLISLYAKGATLPQLASLPDTTRLEHALSLLPPLNPQHPNVRDAMVSAVQRGNIAALKLLMEHGADVHVANEWGQSLLVCAVGIHQAPMVAQLLELGLDAHEVAPYFNKSPLQLAQENPDKSDLAVMREHGVEGAEARKVPMPEPPAAEPAEETCATAPSAEEQLRQAVKEGNTGQLETLLRSGLNPDTPVFEQGETALSHIALTWGHAANVTKGQQTEMAKLLIRYGAKEGLDTFRNNAADIPLDLAMGEFVLDHGADPNNERPGLGFAFPSLQYVVTLPFVSSHPGGATRAQRVAYADMLLARGADPNKGTKLDGDQEVPYLVYADRHDPALIMPLLRAGAADADGAVRRRAALAAARAGDITDLRELKQLGTDLAALRSNGRNLLMLAAAFNQRNTIDYLLSQGFDPKETTPSGFTALDCAMRAHAVTAVRRLQELGVSAKPESALEFALWCGSAEEVGAAMDTFGLTGDSPSFRGECLLAGAVRRGYLPVVQAMLARTPSLSLPNYTVAFHAGGNIGDINALLRSPETLAKVTANLSGEEKKELDDLLSPPETVDKSTAPKRRDSLKRMPSAQEKEQKKSRMMPLRTVPPSTSRL